MSDGGTGAPLRIDNRFPAWGRAAAVLGGLVVVALPARELWRGVRPPDVFSPFFLIVVLGACTVGVPLIWACIA